MMEYQGYLAKVEFDEDAEVFHGEVINLRDVITFEGKSVSELRRAMRESVTDYLAFCHERNEDPDKPFSGRLLVRIDPALHTELLLHPPPPRTLLHLEADRPQMGQPLREARPRRLPRAIPSPP